MKYNTGAKNVSNSLNKCGTHDLKRHFVFNKDIQTFNRVGKGYLASLIIGAMPTLITMIHGLALVRRVSSKTQEKKCLQVCVGKSPRRQTRNYKLEQPYGKRYGASSDKLK